MNQSDKISILSPDIVSHKIKRMVYEIWEKNADQKEIILLGIEGSGCALANLMHEELKRIADLQITYGTISLDKQNTKEMAVINGDFSLKNKNIVVIDDVANSGRTMLYALIPILEQQPKKIEVAVLVNRKHKSFPVKPDIIGHEVSTTLQDNIVVEFIDNENISVFLV